MFNLHKLHTDWLYAHRYNLLLMPPAVSNAHRHYINGWQVTKLGWNSKVLECFPVLFSAELYFIISLFTALSLFFWAAHEDHTYAITTSHTHYIEALL